MNEKIKSIVVTCTFIVCIFGLFLINILKTPETVSTSERRKLAQFPKILGEVSPQFIAEYGHLEEENKLLYSVLAFGEKMKNSDCFEKIGTTEFMKSFSEAAVDQFVWRDEFRSIKARFLFDVLKQKDNNGIYIADGHASKMMTEFKENELTQTIKNINKLYKAMLSDSNVYYSVIPDKNYFLAEENGYPHIDYDKFMQIIQDNINPNIKYIDITEELSEGDYYTTDIHWSQDCLSGVVNNILSGMSETYNEDTMEDYEIEELYPFYGTYYGQSALPLEADTLKYLTNENLENVIVKILNEEALLENKIEYKESEMYNIEEFTGIDPYNVYLSGPKALITLENLNAKTDKELVIFRDSFGSSLAPLLTSEYAKITLVDLRYMASPLVKNLVEFKEGQDVLIIYSTEVLNNGSILKIM